MEKSVFIGSYDKTDMLIFVAKILTLMGKKVILVDTTILKKSRYVVPTMVNEKQYITTYEGIDVAIGFENFEAIKKYQTEKDWTFDRSDDYILEHSKHWISISKEYEKECKELNIWFVDTSFDREEVLNHTLESIEEMIIK